METTTNPTNRIEAFDNGDGTTDAWLLNERGTIRIANLGYFDSNTAEGWVNDAPGGNERYVFNLADWLMGTAALAASLIEVVR